MEIIAVSEAEKTPHSKWIYTIELSGEKVLDVMINTTTGLSYIMQNQDGSTVYNRISGETYPNYAYTEQAVIDFVNHAYREKGYGLLPVIGKLKEDIKKLGRMGYIYGPCCKKGVVCTCGKLAENTENADCKWCFHNSF